MQQPATYTRRLLLNPDVSPGRCYLALAKACFQLAARLRGDMGAIDYEGGLPGGHRLGLAPRRRRLCMFRLIAVAVSGCDVAPRRHTGGGWCCLIHSAASSHSGVACQNVQVLVVLQWLSVSYCVLEMPRCLYNLSRMPSRGVVSGQLSCESVPSPARPSHRRGCCSMLHATAWPGCWSGGSRNGVLPASHYEVVSVVMYTVYLRPSISCGSCFDRCTWCVTLWQNAKPWPALQLSQAGQMRSC